MRVSGMLTQHRDVCDSRTISAAEPEYGNLIVQTGECHGCGATLERIYWDDDPDRTPTWGFWHVVDA